MFQKETDPETLFETYLEDMEGSAEYEDIKNSEYIRNVFFGTLEHSEEELETITRHAVGWSVKRISKVALSILMLAVYELLYAKDAIDAVTANEAVVLCKKFDTEKTAAFINGVISGVIKEKTSSADKSEEDEDAGESARGEKGE